MPSGPDGLVSDPHYTQEFERARSLLLAHPRRWRIIYHYDGDGIASASSALRAFQRLGYPAQATALVGIERDKVVALLSATKGPVLVVDTGSSLLDVFSQHPDPVIVLDHHKYPGVPNPPALPAHVAFVNPLDWGVDGMSELCASTLTWLFTVFLDPVNWDNAPWGLSGAIADRQHVGGSRASTTGWSTRRSAVRSSSDGRGSRCSARPSARRSRTASTRSCEASRAARTRSDRSCTASASTPAGGPRS